LFFALIKMNRIKQIDASNLHNRLPREQKALREPIHVPCTHFIILTMPNFFCFLESTTLYKASPGIEAGKRQ